MKHASQVALRKGSGILVERVPSGILVKRTRSRSTARGTGDHLKQSASLQMQHVKAFKI